MWFAVTAFNIVVCAALAPLWNLARKKSIPRVVLSGHHFNGNLRAFYEGAATEKSWQIRYSFIDHSEYRRRRGETPGVAITTLRLDHMMWIVGADVIMTDHGPGIWRLLLTLRPSIKFVEVWHGVGYKALNKDLAQGLRGYAGVFAASDWDAQESFVEGIGIDPSLVRVTGYARTDPLVHAIEESDHDHSRTVLLAPTWSHGSEGRRVLPFRLDDPGRLGELSTWAQTNHITAILRTHLNSANREPPRDLPGIVFRPASEWPITYRLLASSDVLVTDWSSIAIDFLPLQRPILFLDIPAPFSDMRLDPEDRPGPIVDTWDTLLEQIRQAVDNPKASMLPYASTRHRVIRKAFGPTLDGNSSDRYLLELDRIITPTD